MNARTRTLIAAALVLGVASGPAAAHAAPGPARDPAATSAAGPGRTGATSTIPAP